MCEFNWVKVYQFFGAAVFHSKVLRLKMQKSTFLEKMIFSAFLIDLWCRWLQSGLADSGKHQTLASLLMVDFYAFLKLNIFGDF